MQRHDGYPHLAGVREDDVELLLAPGRATQRSARRMMAGGLLRLDSRTGRYSLTDAGAARAREIRARHCLATAPDGRWTLDGVPLGLGDEIEMMIAPQHWIAAHWGGAIPAPRIGIEAVGGSWIASAAAPTALRDAIFRWRAPA